MENFVERAAALLARALEYVSPLVAFAVCAGLAVFAALLQVFAARAATSVIGDSRRVKRFVVRRGEIVSSNAHRFYNKCVRRMGRRIRRAWKKHALCGREYAGSALKFEMDRRLGKERRPRRIYLPFAFAAVALLQTLLLCKGLAWTVVAAYVAGAAAVWAVAAVPTAAYCAYRARRAAGAAARLSEMLAAKLTLRPAEGRLIFAPSEAMIAPVAAPCPERTLADAVGEYVAAKPDKEVARTVLGAVEKAGNYGCKDAEQAAALSAARAKLKKYTA